ncbi:TPA: hypothetical protein ACGD5C_001504 [Serratia marcescens]
MKIVIFSGEGSHVVNAPDGTLRWHIMDSDGKESVRDVQMYEYQELSTHKFAYVALFREVNKGEITDAIIKHGYDV